MIRIALVEYINTRPFLDGLEATFAPGELELLLLPPADCARALNEGKADLALMPVGALSSFDQIEILPDYCIGGNGPVHSVFLFSQQPLTQLDTILLDRHSRSSNGLTRILMRHFWKHQVSFVMPEEAHFEQIKGNVGGVVIGDKAIRIRERYAYAYDLSEAWRSMTGLSFAFAIWACRPGTLSQQQVRRLHQAMKWGVSQAAETALKWHAYFKLDRSFALNYLTQYIDYQFGPDKHKGLKLYDSLLRKLPQLSLQLV